MVVAIELTWLTDGDESAARVALVWAEAPHRTQRWCRPICAITDRKLFTPALAWDTGPVYGARAERLDVTVAYEPPRARVEAVGGD